MPLLRTLLVRELKASDMTISFINTAQTVVLLVAYLLWTRLAKRTGERRVLLICAFGASFYPFLTALTHSTGPLAIYAGINGFFQAGVDLVFFDIMLDTCPPQNQGVTSVFTKRPSLPPCFWRRSPALWLADHFSLGWGQLIASALRLGGFVLLYLLGVGRRLKSEAAG
ncbi:MFS transporter [Candidatus Amarolinea dominans]|uniref:MFS transporter n=1 Tax=Candidatus Amarolinea dominans TaxID=3140696 RepID=UPI0031CC5D55